ncbi:MAG: FAD-dependent oxidoreductase [Puniceicoccaceae bacterium]
MSDQKVRTIEAPERSLPVIDEADVVVVGGGSSGFNAATAAGRMGARTILIERNGYLGGCTTAPYNTSVGIIYDSDGNKIIRGTCEEFVDRMISDGQARHESTHNQLWPPYTMKVAIDMIEDSGVELYLYTLASDIVFKDGIVEGIIVESKQGRGVILCKTVADCSADADIAAWTGAPFRMEDPDDLQQISSDFIACGVDHKRVREWAIANKEQLNLKVTGLESEVKDFGAQEMLTITIPNASSSVDETGRMHHVGVMPTVKLCLYREAVRIQGNVNVDPLDPKALTVAEKEGIKGAIEHLEYLKETVEGFGGAFIVTKSHLGVRESRQILGDYYISLHDVKNQARFDDVICLNCRALDYHLKGTVFKIEFLKGNHDVPLRALLPTTAENVEVGGRCISCDHLSQASIRGAATCMATGQAAGLTAAMAALQGKQVRDLDVREVQKALIDQSVVLSTVDSRKPWKEEPFTLRERFGN